MQAKRPNRYLTPDRAGAIFFLLLSIAYGLYAFKIPLITLAEDETFNARTMPWALSITGIVLCTLILVLPALKEAKENTIRSIFSGLDWNRAWIIIAVMVVYAFAMTWLGFVLASIIFLVAGYYILGERRIKVLVLASIPLVVGIWLLMSKILGMYIAPGELFYLMGVL